MATTQLWPMRVLYDGACPFCRREIDWLRRRNRELKLMFEDIAAADFDPGRYGLSREDVAAQLHGILPDGSIVRGAETVRRCYEAVGLGWLAAPTRWFPLRAATEWAYGVFARNRHRWGRWFGRSDVCEGGHCAARSSNE